MMPVLAWQYLLKNSSKFQPVPLLSLATQRLLLLFWPPQQPLVSLWHLHCAALSSFWRLLLFSFVHQVALSWVQGFVVWEASVVEEEASSAEPVAVVPKYVQLKEQVVVADEGEVEQAAEVGAADWTPLIVLQP